MLGMGAYTALTLEEKNPRRLDMYGGLLAPKASEASKGAFYLFPGVVSGYCDACESGYCYA